MDLELDESRRKRTDPELLRKCMPWMWLSSDTSCGLSCHVSYIKPSLVTKCSCIIQFQQFSISFINWWPQWCSHVSAAIMESHNAEQLHCGLNGFFCSTFHPSAWIKPWTSSLCAAGSCQTAPVLSAWMTLELFWEPHFPDVEFMCMGYVETGSIYSQPDKPL